MIIIPFSRISFPTALHVNLRGTKTDKITLANILYYHYYLNQYATKTKITEAFNHWIYPIFIPVRSINKWTNSV